MAGEFTPVDEVIAEASSVIKNFTQQERQLARQWAYRALLDIGVNKLNIKVSDPITLTDWSAAKPADFFQIIDLALYKNSTTEVITKFRGRMQDDPADTELFPRIHVDVRDVSTLVYVTEDDNYFHVQEWADTTPSGAYMLLRYYAFPVDSNGLPKIPSTHVLAIVMFIRYMWTMRERKALGEIQEARNTWLVERASARSEANTPNMLEGRELALNINSMIHTVLNRRMQF